MKFSFLISQSFYLMLPENEKGISPTKNHVTQANASALFHTDGPYLSIGRTCCAGVDSVTDCDYNNYIENPRNILKKYNLPSAHF